MASTMSKLETRDLSLDSSLKLIEKVEDNLKNLYDRSIYDKLESTLAKNGGILILKEINLILSGKMTEAKHEFIKQLSSKDLTSFVYAPVVSCDAERIFSVYRTNRSVLSDNRRSFHFENLKQHMIIKCNET